MQTETFERTIYVCRHILPFTGRECGYTSEGPGNGCCPYNHSEPASLTAIKVVPHDDYEGLRLVANEVMDERDTLSAEVERLRKIEYAARKLADEAPKTTAVGYYQSVFVDDLNSLRRALTNPADRDNADG